VRVVKSARGLGVAGAMQAGLDVAEAPLVARMDADDVAHPERLAHQAELLAGTPLLDAVSCGVRLIASEGEGMERYVEWVNGLSTPDAVARERFVECPVIQPSLMMRLVPVKRAGGYRQVAWAEDHDLFLRMLRGGARFGKVPEILLDWRDGKARLTRSDPAYAEEQVWRMKAHHLAQERLARKGGVAIGGAGPIGKRLARLLAGEGVEVKGFFDVHPRRIGERIGGSEVAAPDEIGSRWREAVLLSAVGVEGGREKVRELAEAAGYVEGEDFWCCC
jgi:glycosyltransferase involved in cell wall biosynthesis